MFAGEQEFVDQEKRLKNFLVDKQSPVSKQIYLTCHVKQIEVHDQILNLDALSKHLMLNFKKMNKS
ncbi:hypothetical protein BpHYR1_030729 [Brachionus plicatilis]|uniref:Uncharacterized protein n=1 Tax=Brachionus plicatilis TaxID=10195 RepID=A0A3M7RIG3_BRAPC|nr:hypothetical protein BpHYR1_030729 [Brachionus plicatilis]